jgi:hypothetical protein
MGTDFKSVMLRTPVNQWLGPKKEAPQTRDFLIPATPPSGRHRGRGTGDDGGVVTGSVEVLVLGRRLLLRKHRTQPGTLDGDFWNIRVRRLIFGFVAHVFGKPSR